MSDSYFSFLPSKETSSTASLIGVHENQDEPFFVPNKKRKPIAQIFLAVSIILNCILALKLFRSTDKVLAQNDSYEFPYSSPIVRDIDMSLHTTYFNGSFFHKTIYRQDPSPEVDQAWEDLLGGPSDYFGVSLEDGEPYGLRRNFHIRLDPSEGEGYVASSEASHHLHCVNVLRKITYFNYEYYRDRKINPFSDKPEITEIHATHCIDILRQQLMCQPNYNLMGQVWIKYNEDEEAFAFPDFNTPQQCRDWNELLRWQRPRHFPGGKGRVLYRKDDFSYTEVP